MIVPVLTVVKEAYQELNVIQPGASLPAPLSTLALSKLNQRIDVWNAKRAMVWCSVFQQFTLVPNLSPHTIGPNAATFTVPIRPVSLEGASLNLNNLTPNVFVPIDLLDAQMYEGLSVPSIATAIPTAVYYEEDWPNGSLFFYPIPNYAFAVRLRIRTLLGMVALSDSLDLPPGYQLGLTQTLAEDIATATGRAVPAQTAKIAGETRAVIEANNTVVPVLDLQDGQQRRHGNPTNFNYHSRSFT